MPGGVSYIGSMAVLEDVGEISSQAVGDKALLASCADASTVEVDATTGKLQLVAAGSSKANGVGRDNMSKFSGMWIQGSLAASDAAGGVFSVENSFGTTLVILRVVLLVTTGSSGTCHLDIGVAADATTSASDLIDQLQVNTAGVFDNLADPGSGGGAAQKWSSGTFVNASMAAGATAGLVGKYAIYALDMN